MSTKALFRRVKLPDQVPGGLYLHSMPGREEALERSWAEVRELGIKQIICLAPDDEVARKSPAYAAAIARGQVPCQRRQFPITDFGLPADAESFWQLAREVADALRRGESVVVHCGAGIGRTGTLAIAVLLTLGVPLPEAEGAVAAAGSHPEGSQRKLLRQLANLHQSYSTS